MNGDGVYSVFVICYKISRTDGFKYHHVFSIALCSESFGKKMANISPSHTSVKRRMILRFGGYEFSAAKESCSLHLKMCQGEFGIYQRMACHSNVN